MKKFWTFIARLLHRGEEQPNNKHFISLNFKLALVVVMAFAAAGVLYVLTYGLQSLLAQQLYLKPEVVERNINEAYDDLTATIEEKELKGTDTEELQAWLKEHDFSHLMVYDNNTISFEGGWLYTPPTPAEPSELDEEGRNEVVYNDSETRITPSTFNQDLKNRIVYFYDGFYYVYLELYKEQALYQIMLIVRIILCVGSFMAIVVLYNARVLKRIIHLSQKVQTVSEGDLDAEIMPTDNDEIGRLAESVDAMRDSIVDRLNSEKKAWDANTQLITAMSHDIRTPLTSLIGYLDIIGTGKYRSRQEMDRYIDSCRDKAFQLKEMSDKLFQYFLVFGSQREKKLEIFDAGILLQQLISEHSAELINYGFNIDFEYSVPDIEIQADLSGMRRLFDNISSNIMKYADRSYHVRISAIQEENEITIRIINGVLSTSRKVESNKIGLKTCEKICRDMGGSFTYSDDGELFTVRITIPVYHEPEPDGATSASEAVAAPAAASSPNAEELAE